MAMPARGRHRSGEHIFMIMLVANIDSIRKKWIAM